MAATLSPTCATWAVAASTAPGEDESGDQFVVAGLGGSTLVAVIDALGLGLQAAAAAGVAASALAWKGLPEGIESIVRLCHEKMRNTRGATMGLAILDWGASRMHWLGIGNITGLLLRRRGEATRPLELLAKAGVIGDRIPRLGPIEIEIGDGDLLVIATDGVRTDFTKLLPRAMEPQALADLILKQYGKGSDDALVLVVRCEAAKP